MSPDEFSSGITALRDHCFPLLPSFPEDIACELESSYTSGRHYHSLVHLGECFQHLFWWQDETGGQTSCELHLAVWYHDLVYVPGASDNEERSAVRAQEVAAQLGWTTAQQHTVGRLIRSTAHLGARGYRGEDLETKLISDIDLAILGAESSRYQRYHNQIRAEYSHLSLPDYVAGRRRVVERFLGSDTIFQLPLFRVRFESRARENLHRELQELSGT